MTHRPRLITSVALAWAVQLCVLGASACKQNGDASGAPPEAPKADPAQAGGEAAATKPKDASAKRPAGDDADPSLVEHMRGHFEAIRQIQRAIVSGGVDVARQVAGELAEHESHDAVAEYGDELEAVRAAARAVAAAESLEAASTTTAHLVGACGDCHSMMTKIVSFEWMDAPEETGDTRQRMQRHLWAMERLWEGLVGPSDRLWSEGAAVLAQAPLPASQIAKEPKLVPEVKKLAGQLQALGKKAASTPEHKARIQVYGDLLQLCATCHGVAREPEP